MRPWMRVFRRRTVVVAWLCSAVSPGVVLGADFIRGDTNQDTAVNVADAGRLVGALFRGAEVPCDDSLDVDDNGALETTDLVALLAYLFLGGARPPSPFPDCGSDPSDDVLSCEVEGCGGRGVFFVIDRSPPGRALTFAKEEAIDIISTLTSADEFALVFFDAGIRLFPLDQTPLRATAENRERAKAFIEMQNAGQGTCVEAALSFAVQVANRSTVLAREIRFYGDGCITCPGFNRLEVAARALRTVESLNRDNVPIQVTLVGPDNSICGGFGEALAGQSGGTFTRVP